MKAKTKKILTNLISLQNSISHQHVFDINEKVNTLFIPLLQNQDRYLVLMGGGGSGKSIFAGQKVLWRIVNETALNWVHRILVVRKVQKTIKQSVYAQLKSQRYDFDPDISAWYKNDTDNIIRYKNGNEIICVGLDDVEKLKSIYNITSIWLEEPTEMTQEDINQLDIRLRGQTPFYKQFILSFNPININHFLKKMFFDVKRDNITTIHSTYKDNRFLDSEQIDVLESFKETDYYYYCVYCLGQWGVLGNTIFDKEKVQNRILYIQKHNIKPLRIGYFIYKEQDINDKTTLTNIQWIDDIKGQICIYQNVKQNPYVLGGDPAGEGSDYFAATILDNVTLEQVATYRSQKDEDLYADQLFCLCQYYNNALFADEVNKTTYPTKRIRNLGYSNIYYRKEAEDSATGKYKKVYGFWTDKKSRPFILANLIKFVRENVDKINCLTTLDEMLTFVRNEQGKAEAQEGCHDDTIMSLAIAYYCRYQQRDYIYIIDNDDDYEDEDIRGSGFYD